MRPEALVHWVFRPASGRMTGTAEASITVAKLMTMKDAIARFVRDGDLVVMEGFTHLIPFAAGHEIIRQRKRDLTLARLTPDLIYDQLLFAGCARKMIFSWAGNPGVGPLHAFRRAVEQGKPQPLEIEEYTHFGMVLRFMAGASSLPFLPTRNYPGTDLTTANPRFKKVRSPYSDEELWCVPALNPDVTIVHAQRADADGNTQVWGLYGVQKEAAFASRRVIVTVEEVVDPSVIRSDPNRTLIPGTIVSAVVHEPFGAHPSFVQGAYDRDNDFYLKWDAVSRDEASFQAYLDEWVHGLPDRAAYIKKMGARCGELKADRQMCEPVNYGF
jgi:glutaconate CoA-transferase subunit A